MVSNLAKAAIGVTGVASVGATAIYFTSGNSKSKPLIKVESLIDPRKRLLKKEDNDKWNTPWTGFKAKYTEEPKGPWKFENWTQNKEQLIESFKTQCLELGAKSVEIETDQIVTEVNAYCVTEKEK